jgi:ATP-dependent helicase/nuclease subunit B
MLHEAILIKPSASFWSEVARALLDRDDATPASGPGQPADLSGLRVVVPTFVHAGLLKAALARQLDVAFIPPRITTLSAWLDMLSPEPAAMNAPAEGARLMSLYAGLRQHAWLKKLFGARRNTDLLPLAQTLVTLSDELTQTLLPVVRSAPGAADERWQAALQQLPPSSRSLLSDEAQLVWSIWKSQLDGRDACVLRHTRMMRLAQQASEPLVWVAPAAPDAFHQSFLDEYAKRQEVQTILLDWRAEAIEPIYALAWKELADIAAADDDAAPLFATGPAPASCAAPAGVRFTPPKAWKMKRSAARRR